LAATLAEAVAAIIAQKYTKTVHRVINSLMRPLPGESDLAWRLQEGNPDFGLELPIAVGCAEDLPDMSPAIAEYLTTPPVETTVGLLHPPVETQGELLERAHSVSDELNKELLQQGWACSEHSNSKTRWGDFRYALERTKGGDWDTLAGWGLQVNPGWLHDITRSMLRNRPVAIEVARMEGPRVEHDPVAGYRLEYEKGLEGRLVGAAFAGVLRRISGGFDYTRPVAVVDDRSYATTTFAVDALSRYYSLQIAHTQLQSAGAITAEDRPGRDFVIVSQAKSEKRIDELIGSLRESEAGMIVEEGSGTYWRPGARVSESVKRQHRPQHTSDEISANGILLLSSDGMPSPVALDAASYLNPINRQFTHIGLHEVPLVRGARDRVLLRVPDSHWQRSALLQSLDIAYPDRNHDIYFNNTILSSHYTTYALTYLLRNEVDKVIASLTKLDDVREAMKPRDYFMHNYNDEKGVWSEDLQGIQAMGTELPLHFNLGEVKSAAVIGYGPFSYPALALAPFMHEGAAIEISDLLPQNIEFAQEWFDGNADEDVDEVYRTFAEQFRHIGRVGHFYDDCEQRLRETGHLQVAAFEDLPTDSAQVVIESFVSCSNNIEKYGFYESIRQKARILEWAPGSMMISVHMVGSGGWNNSGDEEGVTIPAANLTLNDIEDGYRSSGLRIVKCTFLHGDAGFREDYKGMVVIFAMPDKSERPQSVAA